MTNRISHNQEYSNMSLMTSAHSVVPSERFTWTKRVGVCDISDLGHGFRLSQVWNDSVDEGFQVESKRTGEIIWFVKDHTEMKDNEVVWWDFVSVRKGRSAQDIRIRLYND